MKFKLSFEFGELVMYKKTRGMVTGIFLGKIRRVDLAWVLQREIESRDWTTVKEDFYSKLILVNYSELKKVEMWKKGEKK